MSSTPNTPASGYNASSEVTTGSSSSTESTTPSTNAMGVHKAVSKIRPTLTRAQSSFTEAITSIESTDNVNLNLPDDIAALSLDNAAKETIKNDISLVKEVQSEKAPLAFPKVQTPLLTPTPTPSTKAAFLEDIQAEIKKIGSIKKGLRRYIEVIHSEEHTVFSAHFLRSQMATTDDAIAELDRVLVEINRIDIMAREMVTPAGTPAIKMDDAARKDYFAMTANEEVRGELKEKFAALKPIVHRIRGVFVSAHVFYKINYALAADKK